MLSKRVGVALAVSAIALTVVATSPVSAGAKDDPPEVGAYAEFIGNALPCGTRHIVLEAPDNAWGLRTAAELMDAQLPSVSIHTRRGLTAANWPRGVHVDVAIGDFGDPLVVGYAAADLTYADPPEEVPPPMYLEAGYWRGDGRRGLWLNTALDTSPFYSQPNLQEHLASIHTWYAAHEFGHTLGLQHHSLPGIMQGRTTDDHDLGPEEAAAIEDTLQVCR